MENRGKILIIDDNEDVLFALNLLLEPYVEKVKVTTQPGRIEYFMTTFQPDVILLDMNFRRDAISGQEGFDCLEQILKLDSQAVVLFMTAYADTDKAVRAIKAGAIDFIPKPWEKEKLLATLSSAIKLRDSRKEIKQLKEQVVALSGQDEMIPNMIGRSEAMQSVFDTIQKLSDTDANILILGENGTGKDLVARSLRHYSPRRESPFITIDLGSIPETLFESELFGYEKGAFTDARKAKAGRMEVASGGTLFLDEIGNLSYEVQIQLLRALQERKIRPVGSTQEVSVDIRLVSATNENLEQAIEKGTFREDLFHRINEFTLRMPDLKERKEDILLFANFFLDQANKELDKHLIGFDSKASQALLNYHWPGNLRQMKNIVKRATLLAQGSFITLLELGTELLETSTVCSASMALRNEETEKEHILEALRQTGNNKSKAAQLLNIDRKTLYNKLKLYNIDL